MDVKQIISQMTLEEKAAMCSGADFWHTEKVDRLGIPASMVSDGPHGLRKQPNESNGDHLGLNDALRQFVFRRHVQPPVPLTESFCVIWE